VKSASAKGIELAEYPGRIFHLSSVGSSMADLTADMSTQHQVPSPTRTTYFHTRAGRAEHRSR
jgi:hypothetical protein